LIMAIVGNPCWLRGYASMRHIGKGRGV